MLGDSFKLWLLCQEVNFRIRFNWSDITLGVLKKELLYIFLGGNFLFKVLSIINMFRVRGYEWYRHKEVKNCLTCNFVLVFASYSL